jgi:hypothetical protein
MISWIVATHDRSVLEANLAATLPMDAGDELVVVEDAPSIAAAYNRGQAQTSQPVRVYVHHDVQILQPELRERLLERCAPDVGIVGVVGSRDRVVPWWSGSRLGSVIDARMGHLDFGPGGPCAFLDGLLLATVHDLKWDETYPGWHLYDHDICRQQLEAGRTNWCLDGGADLIRHSTTGSADVSQLDGWTAGVVRYHEKWSTEHHRTRE